jgi:hypothetical protein
LLCSGNDSPSDGRLNCSELVEDVKMVA